MQFLVIVDFWDCLFLVVVGYVGGQGGGEGRYVYSGVGCRYKILGNSVVQKVEDRKYGENFWVCLWFCRYMIGVWVFYLVVWGGNMYFRERGCCEIRVECRYIIAGKIADQRMEYKWVGQIS